MPNWEYKTLHYGIEGKVYYGNRFWVVSSPTPGEPGKRYGPIAQSRLIGKISQAMWQLELALKELDDEGWELVSTSFSSGTFHLNGIIVLRRPRTQGETGS